MKRTFRNKNKMFHKNAFFIKRENAMVLILFPAIKTLIDLKRIPEKATLIID